MKHPLAVRVDNTTYEAGTRAILDWANRAESRYVCIANVHAVMEAHDDPQVRRALNEADLVTADGMPLVWFLRLTGNPRAERVYGPQLMLTVLSGAASAGVPIGLYGSSAAVVTALAPRLEAAAPGLKITYMLAPPFREVTPAEDSQTVEAMRASGARILFVGLGCPKQELWMAAHRGRIPAVLMGVGAAFDFLAGTKRQAPPWIGSLGLEWLFRLVNEPRRLWRRYLLHNARFALLAAAQLLGLSRP